MLGTLQISIVILIYCTAIALNHQSVSKVGHWIYLWKIKNHSHPWQINSKNSLIYNHTTANISHTTTNPYLQLH